MIDGVYHSHEYYKVLCTLEWYRVSVSGSLEDSTQHISTLLTLQRDQSTFQNYALKQTNHLVKYIDR